MSKSGQNTFRGLGSSQLRNAFFGKTMGEIGLQHDLLSVQSPITGSTLTAPDLAKSTTIRDPISGATLQLAQHRAELVAPVLRQQQVHARNFYLRNDVDVMITTLRNNTKVNRYTNEKIGTAGRPTGLAKELLVGTQPGYGGAQQQQQ